MPENASRSKSSKINSIRHVCMYALPILLSITSVIYFYFPLVSYGEVFYTIALTANIGYFTNYIAIKMLFKPHYKTAFGRQGLIPKNQDKLAESLSQTLIDNFLSKEQWNEYLLHSDLVNKVLAEAKDGSYSWLSKKQNITKINSFIEQLLKDNEDSVNDYFNQLQQQLVDDFSGQLDLQQLLSQGFEWLEEQLEANPEKMQSMIEPIIRTIAGNIPRIADGLSTALDAHIEEQDTIKRGIAKMAKWSADFDNEDIKRYLFRLVASFEFRETLFEGLQSLISEYKDKSIVNFNDEQPSNESSQSTLPTMLGKLVANKLSELNWTELIITQLCTSDIIADENESRLKYLTLTCHRLLFDKIESELSDGLLHNWLIEELVSLIEKLDLRQMVKEKAKTFSPEKMESIFQKMISEQLIFIELLGALLGALSGLALVDIRLFLGLSGLLGSYFLADYMITKQSH